jgi:hypothetical protein
MADHRLGLVGRCCFSACARALSVRRPSLIMFRERTERAISLQARSEGAIVYFSDQAATVRTSAIAGFVHLRSILFSAENRRRFQSERAPLCQRQFKSAPFSLRRNSRWRATDIFVHPNWHICTAVNVHFHHLLSPPALSDRDAVGGGCC